MMNNLLGRLTTHLERWHYLPKDRNETIPVPAFPI